MAPSESTSENRPEAEISPIIGPVTPIIGPVTPVGPIPTPIPTPTPPPTSTATPLSPASPTVTTTAPTSSVSVTVPNTSGTVTFSLVVTDNLGVSSAPAFATVTIQGAPIAVIAATPETIAAGGAINLSGAGSTSAGSIASYTFALVPPPAPPPVTAVT
ncbi:MAG: hypothetical protein ABSC76_09600 [Terracidiphilus sp.]